MELQQLKNLVEIATGPHFAGDYHADRPIRVADASGELHDILSVGWSTEDSCFVICLELEDED